jgi:hypothetical protein
MQPFIQPYGIADLLVVKQNLVGYRKADLAAVQNVMATEVREQQTRRLRREELTLIERAERTEESLHELGVTERFELEQETAKTIQSETQFEAGAEVSAGFGPVSASAFFNFSTGQSQIESQRNATNFAREVVERSVKRIVEKTSAERTAITIEEFEERNLHRFDNAGGDNKTGLYYWLDKLLRLKVVNYGKRVYWRFVLEEPGAFYVYAMSERASGELPPEPAFPQAKGPDGKMRDMHPGDITRNNWRRLAHEAKASGIKPPPPRVRYVTKHITREFKDPAQHFIISPTQIEVPKGYIAWRIDSIRAWRGTWWTEAAADGADYDLDVIVGRTSKGYSDGDAGGQYSTDAVELEAGAVTIGAQFDADTGVGAYSVYCAVRIKCLLQTTVFRTWQMETYDAIVAAYNNQRSEYEEELAQAKLSGGFRIAGRHPAINREIARTELKKACITMWTGYRFEEQAGIKDDVAPFGYPEIQIDNALELAPEIELMENGFDWNNMSVTYLPYYWGRKSKWLDVQEWEDPDPLFQSFLQAGAAIVMVPATPEYTKALLHYQYFGTLPDEDSPLFHIGGIDDTLVAPGVEDNRDEELVRYHSYIREIEQQEPIDNLDREITIDPDDPEAWVTVVPTTLVYLDPNMELPPVEP